MSAAPLVTRADAIRDAARILAETDAQVARLTPDEVARLAYVPGGPSVEELAARIRARRAQAAGMANVAEPARKTA